MECGDKVRVSGHRGEFIVLTIKSDGSEATLWGGPKGKEKFRTFAIERLTIKEKA
jgi:Na+-transporting NADH:ubiquinone oxidoreductase subunit NqrF